MEYYDEDVKSFYLAIKDQNKDKIKDILTKNDDIIDRFTKQVSRSPGITAVRLKKLDSLITILDTCKDNNEIKEITRFAIIEAINTYYKYKSCSYVKELESIRDIVKILLDEERISDSLHECLVRYPNVLGIAIKDGDNWMIGLLMEKGIDKSLGSINFPLNTNMYYIIKSYIDCDPNTNIFGKTLIQHAIESNDVALIDILIKDGADVNKYFSESQESNIIRAVKLGNVNMVKKLIESGIDVNLSNDWKNALYYAVYEKNKCIVNLLLNNGAKSLPDDKGSSLIKYAIMGDYNTKYIYNITKTLFERGVKITGDHGDYIRHIRGNDAVKRNMLNSLSVCRLNDDVYRKKVSPSIAYRLMNLLLENGLHIVDDYTPLYYLYNFKNLSVFKKLTAYITDINKVSYGNILDPLIIDNTRINLMKYLISIGANVNAVEKINNPEIKYISYKEYNKVFIPIGLSPLYKAAYCLSYKKVRVLLENGADVNAPCEGCITMMRKLHFNDYFKETYNDNDDENDDDDDEKDDEYNADKTESDYSDDDDDDSDDNDSYDDYGNTVILRKVAKDKVVNYLVSYMMWSGIKSQAVADSTEYNSNIELTEDVPMLQYAKVACELEISRMKNDIVFTPFSIYDFIVKDVFTIIENNTNTEESDAKLFKVKLSPSDINYISNKFKMFKSIIKLKLNEYMNKVNGI
ncbi:CNPV322 ankyrin repeat protein [Canarypox virus]|uniref:CNPV322 ankyrin repeat protein n=1 Tax=Canarypox virus TaxID=44088 RepID=Q6VZ25_CNPV|nr:CNPV322 ankyrin repeat protein [Canarypox virus]AAR83668.1 CNPV322 ankyrin repeat protein [Canarypox virus]AWD84798.1 ankyrin repeat protein [Canarypox virus]